MGSVASSIGNLVGSQVGGLVGGFTNAAGMNNTFNAGGPQVISQENLAKDAAAQQAAMGGINANQQALAQALLAQSQGGGPANMVMRQAQDRANQMGAGMLANSRGMNPALAARMAAQQSAQGQQAVAGQAGAMGMASQNALGNLYGQQAQQNLGQQQVLQGAIGNQNQAAMGGQQINAGVAAGNAKNQAGLIGGLLQGGGALLTKMMSEGGHVPGHAAFGGDSYANDTVPAMLSPGEIVIPRSKAHDPDLAKEFIDHLMSTKSKKKKGA
jgi:hypothetical protein